MCVPCFLLHIAPSLAFARSVCTTRVVNTFLLDGWSGAAPGRACLPVHRSCTGRALQHSHALAARFPAIRRWRDQAIPPRFILSIAQTGRGPDWRGLHVRAAVACALHFGPSTSASRSLLRSVCDEEALRMARSVRRVSGASYVQHVLTVRTRVYIARARRYEHRDLKFPPNTLYPRRALSVSYDDMVTVTYDEIKHTYYNHIHPTLR